MRKAFRENPDRRIAGIDSAFAWISGSISAMRRPAASTISSDGAIHLASSSVITMKFGRNWPEDDGYATSAETRESILLRRSVDEDAEITSMDAAAFRRCRATQISVSRLALTSREG